MSEFRLLTQRLLLREFKNQDAEEFYLMNNDPLVMQYTGDLPFSDQHAALSFIKDYDHYTRYGYGRWTVLNRNSGSYLGFCGLKYHPATGETDLGFRFIRKYWGQGFATEAARACLGYGFTQLQLSSIIGRAQSANLASIRVLEKIGMTFQQTFDFEGEIGALYRAWSEVDRS